MNVQNDVWFCFSAARGIVRAQREVDFQFEMERLHFSLR